MKPIFLTLALVASATAFAQVTVGTNSYHNIEFDYNVDDEPVLWITLGGLTINPGDTVACALPGEDQRETYYVAKGSMALDEFLLAVALDENKLDEIKDNGLSYFRINQLHFFFHDEDKVKLAKAATKAFD